MKKNTTYLLSLLLLMLICLPTLAQESFLNPILDKTKPNMERIEIKKIMSSLGYSLKSRHNHFLQYNDKYKVFNSITFEFEPPSRAFKVWGYLDGESTKGSELVSRFMQVAQVLTQKFNLPEFVLQIKGQPNQVFSDKVGCLNQEELVEFLDQGDLRLLGYWQSKDNVAVLELASYQKKSPASLTISLFDSRYFSKHWDNGKYIP